MTNTGKLVASAVCIAFGIIMPITFHAAGAAGSIFLPMHIPVLIAGLFLGKKQGFIIGAFTPVLSSLLTGMPPAVPILPIMAVELAAYGFIGGYLYQVKHLPLWSALAGAMIVGRVAAMLTAFCMVTMLGINLSPWFYITGAVLKGLPGIMLQMAIIPPLIKRLEKAFLKIPMNY